MKLFIHEYTNMLNICIVYYYFFPLETSSCNISPRDRTGKLLQMAKLIVWDEAPMGHRFLLEALDKALRDVMQRDSLMGGKLIVLGGDFRQILPVIRKVKHDQRQDTVNACMTHSDLWQDCIKLHLRTNMRILRQVFISLQDYM